MDRWRTSQRDAINSYFFGISSSAKTTAEITD